MPSLTFVVAGAYFAVFALALLWNVVTDLVAGIGAALRARRLPNEVPVSEPGIVVTLVHGTWAREAGWTLPGSPLCRTLLRAADAPVLIQRFTWSGRNSISARRRAVQGLVAHLHGLVDRWPRAQHYVVAHSHGGNVAFQSLADPLLIERIGGLVCLSTPFLTVVRRDLGPVGRIALWWLPVLIIFYTGNFVIQLAAPSMVETAGPVFLLAAVASGFLTARLIDRFAGSVLQSLQYPAGDPSKTLILRAVGDEASAALGATYILSWVSGRLWLMTSRALGRTVDTVERWRGVLVAHRLTTALVAAALTLVCVAALFASSLTWNGIRLEPAILLAGLSLLMIVATLVRGGLVAEFLGRIIFTLIAAPFLLLIALFGIGLGPELLVAGLLFQVTAEATPPGRWVVWQVAASTEESGDAASTALSHSASYQNPKALEILGTWFARTARRVDSGSTEGR